MYSYLLYGISWAAEELPCSVRLIFTRFAAPRSTANLSETARNILELWFYFRTRGQL